MTGRNAEDVVLAVGVAMGSGCTRDGVSDLTPEDYIIGSCSRHQAKFILSTMRHGGWAGTR